jgi:hypothetical protein
LIGFKRERKQSKDYLMLLGKKSNLEQYGSKNVSRKRKINKIFDLGLDIKDEFSPSKSIMSRYSTKNINSKYYGTIEIKKPTY